MADWAKRIKRKELRGEDIICPRCDGFIPNDDTPGLYPGALSRVDNETEICSQCGRDEAFLQLMGDGMLDDSWLG